MELEAILEIESLRYLAQDETRIGRKTETKRVITSRGVKPKVKLQWPREAFWLYGVVEPLTGWQWTQDYTQLNSDNFQSFLNALSAQLGSTVAVIQMDRAPAPKGTSTGVAREHHSHFSTCPLSRTQSD